MKQLQFVGGTTAQNDGFTGPARMLTIDVERWEIRLHDGETPGGHRILNLNQLIEIFMSKDSEFGDVAFGPDDRGILTRIGDRQYALRTLIEGAGITISNPAGTAGNPTISANFSGVWLPAGELVFAETTGTANAFAVDIDDSYPDDDGSIIGLKFHVLPAANATLSVNGGTARPLCSDDGVSDLSNYVKFDTGWYLFFKRTNIWYALGSKRPQEMGIIPIAGITANNVQDALEELKAEIDGIDTGGPVSTTNLWNFGSLGPSATGYLTQDDLSIADGEFQVANVVLIETFGTGGTDNPVTRTYTQSILMFMKHEGIYYSGVVEQEVSSFNFATIAYVDTSFYGLPNSFTRLGATFSKGSYFSKRVAQKGTAIAF